MFDLKPLTNINCMGSTGFTALLHIEAGNTLPGDQISSLLSGEVTLQEIRTTFPGNQRDYAVTARGTTHEQLERELGEILNSDQAQLAERVRQHMIAKYNNRPVGPGDVSGHIGR